MDVNPRTPLHRGQQTPSTPPPPPPPPQFDSTFSAPINIYFHNTIDPATASLTTHVLGPNLAMTFTHSRAPSLFPAATILTGLTKKTTGFLALVVPPPPQDPRHTTRTRTILAWAESGHGHGPEGDLLDARQPSVLPNALWASRVIRLSSLMGISLGHPFDRLTRGGRPGIFRASHVEVKLATHAVYTLLSMFRIGGAVTPEALARLRRRITRQGARPTFEIYFSKKNCRACAAYVGCLCELTGVDMTLCWKDRLVEMEYKVAKMGEARPLAEEQEGVVTVEEDEDEDDVRLVDMVDLTGDDAECETTTTTTTTTTTAQPLGTFLDGLAYCVGQGSTDRVARAVVGLARIRRRQRRSSPAHHHLHYHQGTQPVRETGDAQQDWLATPPPSSSRRRGRW